MKTKQSRSAHCELAPYWGNKLGKNILTARQVSKRGGNITCELQAGRVLLTGSAITVMEAEMIFYFPSPPCPR